MPSLRAPILIRTSRHGQRYRLVPSISISVYPGQPGGSSHELLLTRYLRTGERPEKGDWLVENLNATILGKITHHGDGTWSYQSVQGQRMHPETPWKHERGIAVSWVITSGHLHTAPTLLDVLDLVPRSAR